MVQGRLQSAVKQLWEGEHGLAFVSRFGQTTHFLARCKIPAAPGNTQHGIHSVLSLPFVDCD